MNGKICKRSAGDIIVPKARGMTGALAMRSVALVSMVHIVQCKRCGCDFDNARKGQTGRAWHYCEDCRPKKRDTCAYCGKQLSGQQKRYCSPACASWDRAATVVRVPEPTAKACERCGCEFMPPTKARTKKICSRCAWEIWKTAHPHKARQIRVRCRVLRRHKVAADDIDPIEVFERDGWLCGICGKKVDKRAVFPQPQSPTLDHIVPLAAGGAHAWGNVQCAHFLCNCRKGATEGTVGANQLLLEVYVT
jgi:5-methylcytosine-specific restriction endonuclease McrA